MSRMWSPTSGEIVSPAPVWAKPHEMRSFTPWANPAEPAPHAGADEHDMSDYLDPEMIRAQAYAEGLAEGRRIVEAEVDEERDAIARLAEELENLRPEPPRELGLLLAETVKRLVRQIVGEIECNGDALLERAHAAAEIIADEAGPVRMRLNPADHERLAGARIDIEMVPDSQLSAGTIVLETGEGWLEDGPQVRLERLRAALDGLGVPR